MSGDNISKVIGIHFDIFGNQEVMSSSVIDNEGIVFPETYDNGEPKFSGVLDTRMGTSDQFTLCSTCKSNYLECPAHFGHLKLVTPMFHFGLMSHVKNVLSCIDLKNGKLLITKEQIQQKVIARSNKARFAEIKTLCSSVKVSPHSGTPVPTLKVEIKKNQGLMSIVAEYSLGANEELDGFHGSSSETAISDTKRKVSQTLTAADCYYILKNVSDEDCEILGISRPERMILTVFPIPPPAIRPSVRGDFTNQGYSEHATTHKLVDIIKFNMRLKKEMEKAISTNDNSKHLKDYQDCLQYHIATYFDNESMVLPRAELKSGGNAAKSITSRFKGGKIGRIRGNLQGKRVDYSARTVITSDPNNNLDELGVPLKIARTITYPEIVTPFNIVELTKLVRNGRTVYPGANFVENLNQMGPNGKPVKVDLKYKNKDIILQYGQVVHRHLQNGDIVLFNRQPSLHKMSMMAHKVRVIQNPSYITFRLNVTATTPYNADFDGDEMNLFAPQSEQAKIELMMLADIKNYIISPKDSKPIVNLKQDALLGSYKFTSADNQMTWKEAMNMLAYTTVSTDLIKGKREVAKQKTYTGQEIFSYLIPKKVNVSNGSTVISNGRIQSGILGKSELAGSKNSIIHLIIDSYDKQRAADFMDDVQRINNAWLMKVYGFSVGLGDAIMTPQLSEELYISGQKKIMEIYNLIAEVEKNHLIDRKTFEEIAFSELNSVMTFQAKTIMSKLDISNSFYVQIKSGSKGKDVNVGQMVGSVGQATFENKLIQKKLNGRTIPHFAKQDDSPSARGFIPNPYISGLTASEFFFHNMDGRTGIIDTAIKTADTGYMQRKTIKATEDVYLSYDSTVRNSSNGVVQFIYGDSGYDCAKQMQVKSQLIMMDNETVVKTYSFTDEEQKKFRVPSKMNDDFVEHIRKLRDDLREIQRKSTGNSKVIVDTFSVPFNLNRVISYHQNKDKGSSKQYNTPEEIMAALENLMLPNNTHLLAYGQSDKIKKDNDRRHKLLLRILITEYLAPRKVLVHYSLSREAFGKVVEELKNSFNMNIAQPCEMVGILAAQSIGEPLTQFTLNTFHSTGVSDVTSNMSSMVRFKELISFTKKIKNPFMKIYLKEEYKYSEEVAMQLTNLIENTKLSDVVLGTEIWYENNYLDPDSIFNKDQMSDNPKNIFFVNLASKSTSLKSLPWVIRFLVNREILLEKNITLLMIKTQFVKYWNSTYVDMKGFKKKDKEVINLINNICIMSNNDSDPQPVLHIRLDFNEYNYTQIIEVMNLVLNGFKVKGIEGIEKAFCNKELEKIFDPTTGKPVEKYEYVITTLGSNIQDIFYLEGVDNTRTVSNDVYSYFLVWGIEATRALLIKEINTIFSGASQDVNFQHLSILVDIMLQNGNVTPVNRYGINKLDTDPLSRASFEKTIEQLIHAAVFQEKDKVSSVSSRIIAGRVINGGTGMVDISIDTSRLEQTEFVEDKFLLEVSNIKTPMLMEDPLISDLLIK